MTMKLTRIGDGVEVTDNPAPFWLFYAMFVLGGVTAVWLSLSHSAEMLQTAIGMLIGLCNVAGGLYMIAREPASRVEIDPASGSVRVIRWGIGGRRATLLRLADFTGADVETTEHTDGGPVFRPRLRFGAARDVPVSLFWYQREGPSREIAEQLRAYSTKPDGSA